MRRRIARRTVAAAVAGLGLAAWSSPAEAGGLTDPIELTNGSGKTITQVIFEITPAGAVAPPGPSNSPLMALPGYPDAAGLQVAIGSGTTSSGTAIEAMRLDFGPSGFQPGDTIEFKLTTADGYDGTLPLPVLPPNSGLTIRYVTPTTTTTPPPTGGSDGAPATNTPEPLSVLVWSGLSGLGLAWKRSRKPAKG